VWWDVRAHDAPDAPVAVWIDSLFAPPTPPHVGCHWAAALRVRLLVPELPALAEPALPGSPGSQGQQGQQATSQLILLLHRVHRRLLAEVGGTGARTALIATTPDGSWLALSSTLRLSKASKPEALPAALVLASPLVDLELDAHESHRAQPLSGDPLTAPTLERLANRLAGLPAAGIAGLPAAGGSGTQRPSASTLHRLSPAWQPLAGLPPVMLLWDRGELLSDQVVRLLYRLRESEVPVLEHARAGLGHGWLRLAPWATPEGRADMLAISHFLAQSGVK
jgi:hypothetical protein